MSGPAPDLPFDPPSGWQRLIDGFGWRDAADIFVVAVVVTYLLRIIRDSRAMQMLRGLALLVFAMVIARHFSLHTMAWLVNALLVLWAIALIIVLQPELRRVIVSLGESSILRTIFPQSAAAYHEIAAAARTLAAQRWGGLVVVERETSLAGFAESGVRLDADVKSELLGSIFTPGAPLHDGAVIVREGRLYAAACTLPLSEVRTQAQALGMRHRAALGITEETDALAVIVSEESGKISLAMNGQLTPPLELETLEELLNLHAFGAKPVKAAA